MHIARLVHLLGSLIQILVEEIGGEAVHIHCIALGEKLLLNEFHVPFCDVDRKDTFTVHE